jgi:MGT family glycosyltransferase
MSKILFVNGNLHGHVNPTLPVVKELVTQGDEVYYFSTREFRTKLEASGAIFLDYGEKFDEFIHNFRPHGTHPFYTMMEYMLAFDRIIIPIVVSKTVDIRFDYMIHDVMFGGGHILGDKLKLPTIASCSSFVMEKPPLPGRMLEPGFHPQLDYLYEEMKKAEKEWGINDLKISDIFFLDAPLVLVYTSRLFQPQSDSLDERFRFVGPSITDRKETIDFPIHNTSEQKLIYISLGTINNHQTAFYQKCFEAFSETNYQVILSVGNKTDISSLGTVPDNFIVRNYIPQLEILKKTDVFISHGGLNSISEALYYGVPVIVIPIANDQPAVAKRVSELGAGLELRLEEITPTLLRDSTSTIISNHNYRSHSQELGESFIRAGGYQAAVHEIKCFAPQNIPDICI